MTTLSTLIDRHGVDVLDHLDRDVTIPVLGGLAAQGDVIVIPESMVAERIRHGDLAPVGRGGVSLVQGTHTHTLVGSARVTTEVSDSVGLAVALVEVAPGDTAYLAHPEHGYLGLAPGRYLVRRQREQAEQQRLVAD